MTPAVSSSPAMPDLTNRRHPFHFTTALNVLMKSGIDPERVNILAVGEYENYKGEVIYQEPKPGTALTSRTKIILHAGYSSAVDFMPYQFFYGLQGRFVREGEWEENARRFMAPFDASLLRYMAAARYQILKYSFGVFDQDHFDRFLGLYEFDFNGGKASHHDIMTWSALLPSFYYWAGNAEMVAVVLEVLFGYRFKIRENVLAFLSIPENLRYHLGSKNGRLGKEIVLGAGFYEAESTYEVVISGISRHEALEFRPGFPNRAKLDWVLNLVMPAHLDRRIVIKTSEPGTKLGELKEGACLGFSSRLDG